MDSIGVLKSDLRSSPRRTTKDLRICLIRHMPRLVYPERNEKDPSPARRDQDDSGRAQNDSTWAFFRSL